MPILDVKSNPPSDPPVKKTDGPEITSPQYKGVTVNTQHIPRNSLITHIQGASWIVSYYQQVMGKDSEVNSLQVGKEAVYQQYVRINNLELKVSNPLTQTQDESTKSFDVTGESILYPPVIPNTGDIFLADIGDGREGVFSVLRSERLTIMRESCYRIEYVLISYSVDKYRSDLEKKTIKDTHFVKELIGSGQNPVIVTEDYKRHLSLNETYRSLVNHYFANFFDKTTSTLLVPDQKCKTFDSFIVKAIMKFMDGKENPYIRSIKNYSIELPGQEIPLTIWDALLDFKDDLLPMVAEKLAILDSRCFGVIPQFEGVYYSNVEDVVYPVDKIECCFKETSFGAGQFERRDIRHQFKTVFLGNIKELGNDKEIGVARLQPIYTVTKDNYYVFSEAFYHQGYGEMSQIEKITRDALENKPINKEILLSLSEASDVWGRLEKFYYIPILLILLKMAQQGR